MKKELSRAELKAAKNLLKKLIEKGEFDSVDKLQAEVVIGMIEEIESWESHWDYTNYAQTRISLLHDGYSSTTYEDLTCLLRGMSILYNLYSEGGMFYVTTTHDLEAFSFNRKSTEYAAITLLKRVSNITMKFKETRPCNEGASYYRATWSKLAQKIDADNALEREIEEYAVTPEAFEVATQAEIENAKAEAELTIQFNLQAANNVEITAEDDGSNDDPDEDFLATIDTSIDDDNDDDELVDDPEYGVIYETVEAAVQGEIENAVAEKVKQIELESCLWWINKTAELVAETRKEIEKENLTLARINARWAVNDILTEYVRTILGKGFVGTCFDNSRCCFFPQIKCRASYHKELADSALIFGVNEIYAWVKDYGDGGIHIHGIQDDGGKGWGSTIDLADYENLQQLDAALQIIKARIKKPRNGYVVDVPEIKETQTEIDNAGTLRFNLQAANNAEEPEKIFTAMTLIYKRDAWFENTKDFKTAVEAYDYLQKKAKRYSAKTAWEHSITEVADSKENVIYTNGSDDDEWADNAEIQKLIEERDAKAATDKIAEEKALAEEKARKEKLNQAETTCKALYDDWSKAKKRLVDLRRYREQCKDAAKKAAYDLKIAEFEKTFKPLDEKYNAAWDILIHSKANDFEAEI